MMKKFLTNLCELRPITPAFRLGPGDNTTPGGALARLRVIVLSLVMLPCLVNGQDQKPAFWDDIQSFKRQDSSHFPGTNKILFVGSSSFTKWTDVQDYFPS